jgi:hypothetical protein
VRCKTIYSADIVDAPAANPKGLFDSTPTLTNTATVVPAGHKIKGKSVGAVCPQCEATTQFLSKLVTLHDNAANKLESLCSVFEQKPNVSSVPTEEQFQSRLNAQRLELEKGLEQKASVMACRMLASTAVKLSRIPDADTAMAGSGSILFQLESIKDETEKGLFYQRNKKEIQAAFNRAAAKNVQFGNQARTQ